MIFGVLFQVGEVLNFVPWDVKSHARSQARESVDRRRVLDFLVWVARSSRGGEDLESRSRISKRPRRKLDGLSLKNVGHGRGEHQHSFVAEVVMRVTS